ncbi:MAG TPA: hypothetical protein VJ249_07820 [Candidatus Bathyarchaeia archaeon]|nr:hypothetical protein [Candidatus Bathyarchaeia archaeon]
MISEFRIRIQNEYSVQASGMKEIDIFAGKVAVVLNSSALAI